MKPLSTGTLIVVTAYCLAAIIYSIAVAKCDELKTLTNSFSFRGFVNQHPITSGNTALSISMLAAVMFASKNEMAIRISSTCTVTFLCFADA